VIGEVRGAGDWADAVPGHAFGSRSRPDGGREGSGPGRTGDGKTTRTGGRGLLALCAVPGGIHHSVVLVRDLEASLRFYRDGLGLDLLQDRQVEGDWPDLFDAPSRRVRAVFLGDAGVPDDHAGVLELNVFEGDVPEGPSPSPPRTGFFLLSFFVDIDATLGRLAALGLGGPPRRVTQSTPRGPVTLATVHDPDGLLVLLTPGSITRSA
jgi:catechol 2,3-dioxygenase-like lactoylglutathione lyase family enzyme